MKYQVLDSFKAQTSKGEMELQTGQVITLSYDKAVRLLNEGKIKQFCYWLKSVVDDCNMPCFEIDALKVIYECPHFKVFWNRRLKEISQTQESQT